MNKTRLSVVNFIKKKWSKFYKTGIVYIRVSFNCFQTKHSAFTSNFLPEQLNLQGQWEVAISEKYYTSMHQKSQGESSCFLIKKLSKLSEFFYLEPGLSRSVTDFVEPVNNLIHERHNHIESYITVKMSRKTQKLEIYFAHEGSALAFHNTEL